MEYLLLLRGINVGGNHKVSMAVLKEELTELGFENVNSYINSGNLFFSSSLPIRQINPLITELFKNKYDFSIPFLILDQQAFMQEYQQLPSWWNQEYYRKNVLFFLPMISRDNLLKWVANLPLTNGEQVFLGDFALYWIIKEEKDYSHSFYHKGFLKEKIYKEVTIRNGKTSNILANYSVN